MSRLCVASEQIGGGDRVWLDGLGKISGLRYSSSYPGGAATASWQIALDMRAQHRAWTPGREIGIWCGGSRIWHGELDNPNRDTVWQMNAIGRPSDTKRFLAIAPTSDNAANLNEVVDAAIVRGLGFVRPSSLPSISASAQIPSGSVYIDDALQQVTTGLTVPQFWSVDNHDVITTSVAPTSASLILFATGVGGGRVTQGFATDVVVTYLSATGVVSTVTVSASSRPFGVFEVPLDITDQGLLPMSQATAAGHAQLALNGVRLKFLDPFTVTYGQLVTIGGSPVDLATVRPGVGFNVIVTDPDSAGEVSLSGAVKCVGGVTDYDVDSNVLTLATTDYASDSLAEALFSGAS